MNPDDLDFPAITGEGHWGQTTQTNTEEDYFRLKSRAALLEATLENIPEAVLVTDPDGRLVRLNRAAVAIFGERTIAIAPKDWPEEYGLFLDDAETYFPGERMPLVRALSGETVEAEEMILLQPDASNPIWIAMSASPFYDESKRILGVIVLLRNITYRKQIELSRENHSSRMEALYRFSRELAESGNNLNNVTRLVAVDAAGHIGDACIVTLYNQENSRLKIAAFHHPEPSSLASLRRHLYPLDRNINEGLPGGIIHSTDPVLIPSVSPEQLEAITKPELTGYILEVGVHGLLISPIIGKSGTLGTIILLRDQDRKPYTVDDQSFLSDMAYRTALAIDNCLLLDSLQEQILERLSAKEALDVSEERFRSIFESTTLGIKVLDLEGNILQVNPAFQTMTGYSEAELIGRLFYSFLHPGDAPRTVRLFNDLKLSDVLDFRLEHRTYHKDGSIIWVKTTFSTVKKGGGDESLAFIVGIVENISEQKRIELEVAELKNRLQGSIEQERLHLAQELHDGPMQELYSAVFQIESLRSQVNPQQQELLENMRHDIQKVLEELRDTAKELRPPTLADFGLEKAIRSYIEDFQEKHTGLNINTLLAQDQQMLPENVRLTMFRILQQSLANVVRHAEASQVNVHFSIDAEEAVLEITDDGKGFEIPRNWMGLVRQGHFGLAGAAERIEALGGTLTLQSQPGNGTTVRAVVSLNEVLD